MSLKIDKTLPPDVQILIKAAYHMCNKSYPDKYRISVPCREFERVKSKVSRLVSFEEGGER